MINFKILILKILKKSKSLELIIIIPFIIQIIAIVSITGYLSFKNGQKTVNNISFQLLSEVNDRVEEKIRSLTFSATLINKLNIELVALNELDPDNKTKILKHFHKQIKHFPYVAFVFYVNSSGDFFGVRRLNENNYNLIVSDKSSNYQLKYYKNFYEYNQNQITLSYKKYDPRIRPWYTLSKNKQNPKWSKIYTAFKDKIRAITNSLPIYEEGKTKGVFAVSLYFDHFYNFLSTLKIGKTGQIFIIDKSGIVVATSTPDEILIQDKNTPDEAFKITNSNNVINREAGNFLLSKFNNNLAEINKSKQLNFNLNKNDKKIDFYIIIKHL